MVFFDTLYFRSVETVRRERHDVT